MTNARLELASPEGFESVRSYINEHLAPVAAELHRLVNESFAPGSTSAEEGSIDAIPSDPASGVFETIDRPLRTGPKSVVFDGAEYFQIPKDVLRSKQVRVVFSATTYCLEGSHPGALFRLVRADGMVIEGSSFGCTWDAPKPFSCELPIADKPGCIVPSMQVYHIQGKALQRGLTPVCRRFSLSLQFV